MYSQVMFQRQRGTIRTTWSSEATLRMDVLGTKAEKKLGVEQKCYSDLALL
jgi:hypothetical protein